MIYESEKQQLEGGRFHKELLHVVPRPHLHIVIAETLQVRNSVAAATLAVVVAAKKCIETARLR